MIGIEELLKEVDQQNCSMWSHGNCAVCGTYKDRGGLCAGYPTKPNDNHAPRSEAMGQSDRGLKSNGETAKDTLKIRLKLIDVENNTSRICELAEAKTWDWGNPAIMRLIGDWQIKNYETLLFILNEKELKGLEEVVIYESPRYKLLAGG
jgi:hypothetical protein